MISHKPQLRAEPDRILVNMATYNSALSVAAAIYGRWYDVVAALIGLALIYFVDKIKRP